jgi:hypothetical protein
MAKKRYRPEEIISKLCEEDVLIRQGKKVVEVIKVTDSRRLFGKYNFPAVEDNEDKVSIDL